MNHRLRKFDTVFNKLFVSVMLALILFASCMVVLTYLVHDTSTNTRHQIIASQVTHQLEPVLTQLQETHANGQFLETRYLLALIRRSFNMYSESLDAQFGLYDGKTGEAIIVTNNLPEHLPPRPKWFHSLFHIDDQKPTQIQVTSSADFVVLYHSNISTKPPISPAFNLITGTFLLLIIMSGMLWFITRTMTWRINQLSRQITQLGAGDFSVRVTPVGNDEIATLAHGFNQTAERIESLMNANKLLLAHASHEIRTPITRIRLQIEMMSMLANQLDEKGQEKFLSRANAINRDLTGLNDLVESILLVSRMEAGHAIDKVQDVALYDLIKNEVQHYPNTSFNGADIHVKGQDKLLTHMIRNLLDNAHLHGIPPVFVDLYAIDNQGKKIPLQSLSFQQQDNMANDNFPQTVENIDKNTLADELSFVTEPTDTQANIKLNLLNKTKSSIFSRKKDKSDNMFISSFDKVCIAIMDNGTGIPEEKRGEIFSPFVRLQQEKKGSGLGLSLVAQIVKAHQGEIITDTLDGKTRFLVTLPVVQG